MTKLNHFKYNLKSQSPKLPYTAKLPARTRMLKGMLQSDTGQKHKHTEQEHLLKSSLQKGALRTCALLGQQLFAVLGFTGESNLTRCAPPRLLSATPCPPGAPGGASHPNSNQGRRRRHICSTAPHSCCTPLPLPSEDGPPGS